MGGKKRALMLADTRPALIGQMLIQISKTNKDTFDEVIIFDTDLTEGDKRLMQSIMPCRFVKFESPISEELLKHDRFKRFSLIMFARYEMFRMLNEYCLIMWIDTDVVIQGSLKELLSETEGYGFSILCEDPQNKSAKNVDYMRTNFFQPVPEYNMNAYLYCTGTIIVRDNLKQPCDFTDWCYKKTLEWADNLNLPDQGVLNALTQEFKIKVKPIGHNGRYGCYPYVGRDCSNATTVHSWGTNKFWNNWYLNRAFPVWEDCYQEWVEMGGTTLNRPAVPEISVIIPTYKPDFGYFRQCIDSLIDQQLNGYESYSNYEVIIVSEPVNENEIKAFVESYHDPRLTVYFNEKRLGIAASLNRGMRLAKGTYIARIDDDDIAAPTRFEKQTNYLKTHPDIDLCTSDYLYFGDMNDGRVALEGEMARAWSVLTCPFDHPTLLFRREFFVDNNLFYDEERGFVEDWELWQRAFHQGMQVGCVHDILLYHRWHNGSAGQTNKTVEMMREMIRVNFKELGVDVYTEDLHLLSPWNGKVTSQSDYEKLENYFRKALDNNTELKIYDSLSLARAFSMRMSEAKCGVLAELIILREEPQSNGDEAKDEIRLPVYESEKHSKIKAFLKRLLKPIYQPIRHRFQEPLIDIQKNTWTLTKEFQTSRERWERQIQELRKDIKVGETKQLNYAEDIRAMLAKLESESAQINANIIETNLAANVKFARFVKEQNGMVEKEINRLERELIENAHEQAENMRQELSAKVYEQAENTRQELSAKVYEQAENTRQELSAKVYEQAENTRQELSVKLYTEAENTCQELSGKIYNENEITRHTVLRNSKEQESLRAEMHRHIDFTYRDIMVALERQKPFLPETNIKLVTDYPVAYQSLDHLYPHGTIRDNTRYPRFVEKCEELLGRHDSISFLDLGCSGGGMVLEAALRGHISMGLEGSDCSKKEQRAEWRLLGDRLQTCDITKPFQLMNNDGSRHKFDIITAWEVMEHIEEEDLPQLFKNIDDHLAPEGYFIASVANWDDIDPISGVNWHVTCHPYEWWKDRFEDAGFSVCSELFAPIDLARGGYNPPHCYEAPYPDIDESRTFHMVVRKK